MMAAQDDLLQDSLIREIDEDLRRDRMLRLWKRYRLALAGLLVLVLASVAAVQIWKHFEAKRLGEAAAAFAEAQAAAARDPALAAAGFAKLAESGPKGYALMARFEEAALLARQGNRAEAIAAYEAVARQTDEAVYRDLAMLLSVMVAMQAATTAEMDLPEVQAKLTRLAEPTNPWRFSARELQALIALKSGQLGEANRLLKDLRDDAAAPAGIRERAELLLSQTGQG
jgi:hypothetical protein